MSLDKISLPSPIMDLWSDLPPIEQANLPKHPTLTWEGIEGVRKEEDINAIIIHHTASEATLVNQANYHINTHGWPGLSYHIVISNGMILQVNDLLLFTYHASANNGYSVAICIHGDLSKREMTEQERKLLYAAILTVKSLLPITRVLGHNQVNPTSCPCTNMDRIRQEVASIEQKMKQNSSWSAKMSNVADFVNEVNYLTGLLKQGENDGTASWSMSVLTEVIDIFKDKHLL